MNDLYYLKLAGRYAEARSGCTKVKVGSCIVTNRGEVLLGANQVIKDRCNREGCLRVAKYGENSKLHRNPEDCRAIHSEIDAICAAAQHNINIYGATIFVTRYPCEGCAKAIVAAGISHVVYGRDQLISEQTKQMFDDAGITYRNEPEYKEEDTVV